MKPVANQLVMTASVVELAGLRYTPAGVPALDLRLEHESDQEEAGQRRQVKATVRAVAFGALAERLVRQAAGSSWRFTGFVASPRLGKSLVFHIQEFSQD